MPATALVPLMVVAAIVATDVWVYDDAKHRAERGAPVVVRSGSLVIDTPAMWATACLLVWVFFFPLYLTNRG